VYVRSKIAKGETYYQIVEGVREGPRVRQRVVIALGRTSNPHVALEEWRQRLKSLQWRQNVQMALARGERVIVIGEPCAAKKDPVRVIERRDAVIAELKSKIKQLSALLKSKKIGTTPRRKDG
jgi:hypothetical protein